MFAIDRVEAALSALGLPPVKDYHGTGPCASLVDRMSAAMKGLEAKLGLIYRLRSEPQFGERLRSVETAVQRYKRSNDFFFWLGRDGEFNAGSF